MTYVPGAPNTFFANTLVAGLYRSGDNGLTWVRANRGLPETGSTFNLAVAPGVPVVLYAIATNKVFKSIDLGANWAETGPLPSGSGASYVSVDPNNSSVILTVGVDPVVPAGATQVHVSSDGGLTWVRSTGACVGGAQALADAPARFDPNDLTGMTVLLGCRNGLFASSDGGLTWSQSATEPVLNGSVTLVRFDSAVSNRVFAAIGQTVYRSDDGGGIWTASSGIADSILDIMVSSSSSSTLYVAGTAGVWSSGDTGATFVASRSGQSLNGVAGVYPKMAAIAQNSSSPATLLVSSRTAGIFRSTDSGASWSPANTGLLAASSRALLFDPNATGVIYAGNGDGMGNARPVYKTTDGGLSWTASSNLLQAGHTRSIAADANCPGRVFIGGFPNTNRFGLDIGLYTSADFGVNWSTLNGGLSGNLGTIRRVLVTPPSTGALSCDPSTVYFASSKGIYLSMDSGTTLTAINTGLPSLSTPPDVNLIINIEQSVSNPNILYAALTSLGSGGGPPGTSAGVYKSLNGGMNWSPSNGTPPNTLPEPSAFAIAIDPANPDIVYAADSDALGALGFVYKSTNGGLDWSNAGAGLTRFDIRALLMDPTTPTTLYAAMAGTANDPGGIFKTSDGGVSWRSISIGLPQASATALALDPADANRLLAGTATSVFEITQVADADSDGAPTALENAVLGTGDGNGDGTPDASQTEVVSLDASAPVAKGTTDPITIAITGGSCSRFEDAHSLSAQALPQDGKHSYPHQLLRFEIPECGAAEVTITYHSETSFGLGYTFRNFGPTTPGDATTQQWYDFSSNANASGNQWIVSLTDGLLGDHRPANNSILFIGAVAFQQEVVFTDGFE